MVQHIIRTDILRITRIFPRSCGARKKTTQLTKYPYVLYAKPSNKVYILHNQLLKPLSSIVEFEVQGSEVTSISFNGTMWL